MLVHRPRRWLNIKPSPGQSQQTQNICIIFVQRRRKVFDVGPTLYKCSANVFCLLGCEVITQHLCNFYTTLAQRLRRWSNIV